MPAHPESQLSFGSQTVPIVPVRPAPPSDDRVKPATALLPVSPPGDHARWPSPLPSRRPRPSSKSRIMEALAAAPNSDEIRERLPQPAIDPASGRLIHGNLQPLIDAADPWAIALDGGVTLRPHGLDGAQGVDPSQSLRYWTYNSFLSTDWSVPEFLENDYVLLYAPEGYNEPLIQFEFYPPVAARQIADGAGAALVDAQRGTGASGGSRPLPPLHNAPPCPQPIEEQALILTYSIRMAPTPAADPRSSRRPFVLSPSGRPDGLRTRPTPDVGCWLCLRGCLQRTGPWNDTPAPGTTARPPCSTSTLASRSTSI